MDSFKELYYSDLYRYVNNANRWIRKFHYYFRKAQTCSNNILKYYYLFRYRKLKNCHCIEIPYNLSVGKGLYIGHL